MSETERHYAQIEEKETLASTWACEKFPTYVLGKNFTIETEHKPLVPLLGIQQSAPSDTTFPTMTCTI